MKLCLLPLVVAAVIGLGACERHELIETKAEDDAPITLQQIHDRGIIGELGVPMGKVVVVEGVVVDGNTMNSKRFRGQYFLKVNSVDGVELEAKPTMEFYKAPGCFLPNVAQDSLELRKYHKMQVEDHDFELSDAEFEKAHKAYVGSSLSLYVYEEGGYDGGPFDQFPDGAAYWQDHGFWFHTHLSVIKSADASEGPEN